MRRYSGNFVYSGYVYDAAINSRGSGGTYWSSTGRDGGRAYRFGINNGEVDPGVRRDPLKDYGRPIRCFAE